MGHSIHHGIDRTTISAFHFQVWCFHLCWIWNLFALQTHQHLWKRNQGCNREVSIRRIPLLPPLSPNRRYRLFPRLSDGNDGEVFLQTETYLPIVALSKSVTKMKMRRIRTMPMAIMEMTNYCVTDLILIL